MEMGRDFDPQSLEQAIQKLQKTLEDYVVRSPYTLNPKSEMVSFVIKVLAENQFKYGFPYCGCKVRTGTNEDEKIICPCSTLNEDINNWGHCSCGLFVQKDTHDPR